MRPSKILCVGKNYAAHAKEMGGEVPPDPLVFLKPSSSVIGDGESIVIPSWAGRIDYEGEIAVVIGRPARGVAPGDAWKHVGGIVPLNDVTARDLQRKDRQWARAKGFDTFCPMGPWIATDLDSRDLVIRSWVNGELRQDGRTSEMIFGVAELLSFISGIMTLFPGDLVSTGTPAGVGPLGDGDRVRVRVEHIGDLENPVRNSSRE